MIRFLFRNMKGHRVVVAFAILLTFVAVASDLLMAFPLKFILDKIVHHRDPAVPFSDTVLTWLDRYGTRNGLDLTEVHTQLGVILFSGALLLVLGVIGALVAYAQMGIAASVAQDLGANLRRRVFDHLEQLSLAWHSRQRVGDLVQRITGNISDIEKLVTDGLVDLLSGILTLGGIVLVILLINWQFAVVTMSIVPPLFAIVVIYTRVIKQASRQTAKAAGQVAQVAAESVGSIVELKAFTAEKWAAAAFGERVERQRQFGARAGRRQSEFNPLVLILVTVSNLAIITVGSWIAAGHGHHFSALGLNIPAQGFGIGSLTVFLTYSKQLYQPMRNLSKLTLLASTGASGAERIQEVLDAPKEELAGFEGYDGPARVRGEVVYKGVVFGYEEERPVLHGIDLSIPVGKRLALVGLSGSGKTTLVRLLPRFYEMWDGTITIDGRDVRSYPLEVLRQNIGLVLQDSVLFEGTISENIALGRPEATKAQIAAAAREAFVHDTITSMPLGYDTPVREGGRNFSSGQRQRIAIARAILRDSPILILDEPTANLDVEAEAEVMRAVERLTVGRTVVIISHRLSTLGHVDEIAVLERGRIVERGTYAALKHRNGVFSRLLAEQNRYAEQPQSARYYLAPSLAQTGDGAPSLASASGALSPATASRDGNGRYRTDDIGAVVGPH